MLGGLEMSVSPRKRGEGAGKIVREGGTAQGMVRGGTRI